MTTTEELIAARDVRDREWQEYRAAVSDGSPVTMADMRRAFMAGFDLGENWNHGNSDPYDHAALIVRHHLNGGIFDLLDEVGAIENATSN